MQNGQCAIQSPGADGTAMAGKKIKRRVGRTLYRFPIRRREWASRFRRTWGVNEYDSWTGF
jgi:hypothetical protein